MARYVVLVNWTDQGVKNAKETVSRLAAARQVWEKFGGRITDAVWTIGQHDMVLSAEAPDDETMAAIGLAIARLGNIRTTTLRAFGEAEMQRILQKI